ncbi:hypothetical protein [Ancylobacter rudongensis]|uniref:Uncharacterized protein n=1 Tax=Ancylobacter rudongensis TaxID=177413 RepID=A0A1G4PQ44_9HYPH|nr:hypothetical protein [Ancylobacter rudongensis]SCW34305.1 hypothetical protein SAMN05660859_0698 [Ancylobacter rudongensis]
MAKLPALVDALAKHDPRGLSTVKNYARIVREAGLLPTTKRGNGASDMGEGEVAKLLLGLAEVANVRKAPRAIEVLSGALVVAPMSGAVDPANHLEGFDLADRMESLGEFLQCLVGGVRDHGIVLPSKDGSRNHVLSGMRLKAPDDWGGDAYITFNRTLAGEFTLHFHGPTPEAYEFFRTRPAADLGERCRERADGAPVPGISFEVEIGVSAIASLAGCLATKRRIAPRRPKLLEEKQ